MEEHDYKPLLDELDRINRAVFPIFNEYVDFKDFTINCVKLPSPPLDDDAKRVLAFKMGRLQLIHDMISNIMDFCTYHYFHLKNYADTIINS